MTGPQRFAQAPRPLPEQDVTITRIQQTRRGRFALFDKEGFLFSLDSETFFTRRIEEGLTLAPEELAELRGVSETRRAADKALDYLSVRDYAAGELYQKLCQRFDEHSAAAAVAKAAGLGLLDDERFARRRASYLMQRSRSRREIARQLAEKGVDRDLIDRVLEELYQPDETDDAPDPETAAALALVRKHYARKLAEGRREAVLAALARRGFGYAAARDALALYAEELEQEAEALETEE